jgi:hypothetical protein
MIGYDFWVSLNGWIFSICDFFGTGAREASLYIPCGHWNFSFFFSMILLPYLQVDQIPGNSRLTPALYVVAYTFTSSWAGGEEPREWGLLRSDDVFRWSAVEHVLVSHEHSCSAG